MLILLSPYGWIVVFGLFAHFIFSEGKRPRVKTADDSGKMVPFITMFRAGIMLLTILSILGVDFSQFPRCLAKTENFGTSMVIR